MGACVILTPFVVAAWPAFSGAIVAAAASLGYTLADQAVEDAHQEEPPLRRRIKLDMDNSELVTDNLGRDQHIRVSRAGINVTFSRNDRGRAEVCVTGEGMEDSTLRAAGEELGRRVVQQYVHQHLVGKLKERKFHVVEENVGENHSIRIKVRHWEN